MKLRVVVLGKDPLARAGLAALLSAQPQLEVAGQAAIDELDTLASGEAIDAIALDPGSERELPDLHEAPPVVVLVEEEPVAADALAAGARGLLRRDASGAELAAALVAVAAGLMVIDPELAALLLRPRAAAALPEEPLTPRELEVLQLLSLGLSNKAIAARLGISDHTAKFHVNAILGKLGAGSRSEAIVRAARAGLVAL